MKRELFSALIVAAGVLVLSARAADVRPSKVHRTNLGPSVNERDLLERATGKREVVPPRRHPLEAALQYAVRANQYARDRVRDYTCVLIRRERIDGDLKPVQTMKARVRTRVVRDGRQLQPYSVFVEFSSPAEIRGRKVLYVQGRNDNKMLIRNGGKRFNYVTVKLDPTSDAAMRESLVPITGIGFEDITQTLINLIQEDMQRDPQAANTKVKFFKNAKVNGRLATRICVLHPSPEAGFEFAEANVYIDDELRVPIRLEASTWPSFAGDANPVLFEYTYTDLKLNVGLTDADFRTSLLERAR